MPTRTPLLRIHDMLESIWGIERLDGEAPKDMEQEGLKQGDTVTLSTAVDDGVERSLSELQVVAYDIPRRNIAGYYLECNGLIPLWHFAEGSKVPAAKSVTVRIAKDTVPEIIEGGEIPTAAT
jgi:hypothetical protein